MKKTVTNYESAEETTTRVQCDHCVNRFDDRADEDLLVIALDCVPQEKSYFDDEFHDDRWDHRQFSDSHRLHATEVQDMCRTCYDGLFSDIVAAVTVEEADYYVESSEEDQYFCDFCEDHLGEEPTHSISINPRIMGLKERSNMVYSYNTSYSDLPSREERTTVVTRKMDEEIHANPYQKIWAERDNELHSCHTCAVDVFGLSSPTVGFLQSMNNSIVSFFKQVGETLKPV